MKKSHAQIELNMIFANKVVLEYDVKCSTDMKNQNYDQSHSLPLTCKFMIWTKQMPLSLLQPYSYVNKVGIFFAFTFLLGFMLLLKFCHHMKVANYFL